MATYKYRLRDTYNGVKIDVRSNDLKEFNKKVNAKKAQIDRGDFTKMTVGEWREKYIRVYKAPNVSSSWADDLYRYSDKLKPIDDKLLVMVRPADLQEILNDETGKAISTIKKVTDFFSGMFRQAWREGLIPDDIAKGIKLPSGRAKQKRRAITPKERALLLKAAKLHPQGLFFVIMLYAGLRPNEVRALTWADVNLKDGIISVSKALDEYRRVKGPKTSAGVRKVPIVPELREWLKPKKPFDLVCPNGHGKPMTEVNYKDAWHSFKRQMHIAGKGTVCRNKVMPPYVVADDLSPYCLRHTFGTDLEKKGVPINIAKVLMGHADIKTTAQIYTHFDDETLKMATKMLCGQKKGRIRTLPLKNARRLVGS